MKNIAKYFLCLFLVTGYGCTQSLPENAELVEVLVFDVAGIDSEVEARNLSTVLSAAKGVCMATLNYKSGTAAFIFQSKVTNPTALKELLVSNQLQNPQPHQYAAVPAGKGCPFPHEWFSSLFQ